VKKIYFAPANNPPLCGGDEAGKKKASRQKNKLFPLRTRGNPALPCLVGRQAQAYRLHFFLTRRIPPYSFISLTGRTLPIVETHVKFSKKTDFFNNGKILREEF